MKKLMTALAAVAGAIGLQAAAFTDTGTSFEPAEAPSEASTTPFTAAVTQGELQSGTYWNLPAAADDVEVNLVVDTTDKVVTGKGAVKKYASESHYATLSMSIGTNEVERYAANGGTVVNLGGESSGVDGTSLHFDSLVKFTAFDQDKTPAEVLGEDGKIAIWVRENLDANGDPVSTNLIVTAGYVNESYGLTPTNYVCTYSVPAGATLCDWHRVTVKAMRTIVNGDVYPGFAIAIDGNVIGTDADDKGFGNFPDGISLTNIASGFDDIGGVFPSVQKGSANANVKSVAFKGIGEVDDLVFTEEPPIEEFAESGNVTIRGDANVTGFTYTIGSSDGVIVQGNSVTIPTTDIGSATVTISGVTCAAGYVYGNLTAQGATISGDAASEIADMAVITINTTLGGATVNGETFATAAEAFDAINGSSESAFTVSLIQDAFESITLDNASATVVLDLAGNDITGDSGDGAVVISQGTLIITNSTVEVGTVDAGTTDNAVYVEDGAVIIGGGIYDGMVGLDDGDGAPLPGCKITDGKFLISDNVGIKGALDAAVVEGLGSDYSLVEDGEGYYVIVNATAEYEVTYVLDLDGATNAVDNIANYTITTPEFTLLPAGCSGYTFVAWTNEFGAVIETIAGGETGDLTLYASWEEEIVGTYEVTVTPTANATYAAAYEEGGAEITPENDVLTVTVGKAIVITATPAEGYEYATTPEDWTAGQDGEITIEVDTAGTVAIPAPTLKPLGTYEVTVTPTANATYAAAYKVGGAAITPENDVLTVTVAQTIVITATPSEDYEYATTPTGWTAGQDGKITIEVSAAGTVAIPAPTQKQGGLDPASGTVEVTVAAADADAAEAAAKAAIKVPTGATVDASVYAEYFTYDAESAGEGSYTVTITDVKDTIKAGVAESAVERLTSATATAIEVPAGLYYSITPSTALPISGTAAKGLSTGGTVTIGKPGTTAGFYEIKVSATPIQ